MSVSTTTTTTTAAATVAVTRTPYTWRDGDELFGAVRERGLIVSGGTCSFTTAAGPVWCPRALH